MHWALWEEHNAFIQDKTTCTFHHSGIVLCCKHICKPIWSAKCRSLFICTDQAAVKSFWSFLHSLCPESAALFGLCGAFSVSWEDCRGTLGKHSLIVLIHLVMRLEKRLRLFFSPPSVLPGLVAVVPECLCVHSSRDASVFGNLTEAVGKKSMLQNLQHPLVCIQLHHLLNKVHKCLLFSCVSIIHQLWDPIKADTLCVSCFKSCVFLKLQIWRQSPPGLFVVLFMKI